MTTDQNVLADISGVYTFLDQLPERTLARLYQKPSSCLTIFRLLPVYARHIVLDLLWHETPFSLSQIEVLFRKAEGKRQLESAIAALTRLHILTVDQDILSFDESFRCHFRQALTGGGNHQSFGVPSSEPDSHAVDVAFLDKYANDQWETILHFMVGSDRPVKPSDSVLALLEQGNLMIRSGSKGKMTITSRGFQFLLEEVNTQLWGLLLKYLEMAEAREMDLVEVIGFLFMLGSLELGRDYSTSNLSIGQRQMLQDLSAYGLIYQRKSSSSRYYPTRLATTLTSSAPPLISASHAEEEKGFLILETNYRVYAYTSNPLQIAVLNLFITLKSRFANLVIGSITRESVKAALKNGITAEQIVAYLNAHAHPQMRKQDPLLPPTVTDQIRLWELEKNRVQSNNGYLYDDFRAEGDFNLVRDYARQLDVVVWEASPDLPSPACWRLFVTEEGHPPIRDYIERRMAAPQR